MFRIRTLGRHRLAVLLLMFGLCLGAAVLVLAVAIHAPAVHVQSRLGLWLIGLTAVLLALCGASLHEVALARRGPPFPRFADVRHDRFMPAVSGRGPPAGGPSPVDDQLRVILEHLPASFLLMDQDRRILTASANFERVTGRGLDQVVGRHCTRALWSDGFCAGCPTDVALHTGRPEREVVRVSGTDGAARFLEHLSIPVGNGPSAFLEVVTDITDRKSLQDGMAKAERLAVAGEMASVVTHEMRNSLTSVKMILQLLQEADADGAGSDELVGVALNSLHHAEGVLNELLQFAGPAPIRTQDFDPVRMTQEAVALVRPHVEGGHVDLSVRTEPMPPARGDPEQLKSALLNLLLNAFQAVRAEGRVVLHCRREYLDSDVRDPAPAGNGTGPAEAGLGESSPPRGASPIFLARSSEVLVLEVEDSGPGIPENLLDRIFDPFFTTKAKGTGLGLPMVKRIANAHRGIVTVGNLHPGCRFSIVLPFTGGEAS